VEFFDVVHTQRAIRKFKPDPVADDAIWQIIDAAIRAPSGGNTQPWAFLVVRDAAKKAKLAEALRRDPSEVTAMRAEAEAFDPTRKRMRMGSIAWREDVSAAPVIIIPCLVSPTSPSRDMTSIWSGSSIYQAVQNLMLAARALGLGTLMTTANAHIESLIRAEFGIPDDAMPVAFIPVGYPDGQTFGPTTRKPVESVTYWDAWQATRERALAAP
jgi:nitroreductase